MEFQQACSCTFCIILRLQSHAQWFEAKCGKLSHLVIQHPGLSVCINDFVMLFDGQSHSEVHIQHSCGAFTNVRGMVG